MAAASASTNARPLAHVVEGWKRGGLMKVHGIPAPTGPMEVGCVDVMHRFAEDDRGLLVRLFYPTEPGLSGTHQYAQWTPNHRYIKGYLDFLQLKMTLVMSTIVRLLNSPKSPSLCEAPLLKGSYAQLESTQPSASTQSKSSSVDPNSSSVVEPDTQSHPQPEVQPTPEPEVHLGPSDGNVLPAADDSGPSPSLPKNFPVIVFSHGMGAMRTTYTGICCDLASHGYVVASVEHRDRSACLSLERVPVGLAQDGKDQQYEDSWIPFYFLPPGEREFPVRHKQVKQRSSEVRKALDLLSLLNEGGEIFNMMGGSYDLGQFKGRLKLDVAAVMGHSFGGATTIQALSEDSRFKCGIALDSWMVPIHRDLYKVGVSQPLLFVNSESWQWVKNVQCMMKLVKPPGSDGISPCHVQTIRGTEHKSQSDSNFVTSDVFRRVPLPPLDRDVAHAVNMDLCHAFLKRFLWEGTAYCQQPIPNLDGGEGASQHIIFGSNVNWQESSGEDTASGEIAEKKGAAEGVPNESGEAVLDNGQANLLSNGISVAKTSDQEKDNQAIGLEQGGEENLSKTDTFEDSGGKADIAVEEN